MFSQRAIIMAVLTAFVAGVILSLAIRPPGQNAPVTVAAEGEVPVRIRWRVPMWASRNLPGTSPVVVWMAEELKLASNGAIVLDLHDPGEIVPAFAITDAVRERKVEAGVTWIGYDQGKIPAAPLFAAVPFGFEPWAFMAWWYHGGGRPLAEEIYAEYNIKPILCTISGPETAGWFREPIQSTDDVEGLKIRFAGLGGKVMQNAGASVTMLPAGEIFQALETGVIDATEYAQPISDQALGFNRIAKYNYYPGWHQPFSATHLLINLDIWNQLSSADQSMLEGFCTGATGRSLALTESEQGSVIAGFKDIGVTASYLPEDLLRKLQDINTNVLNEEAAKDPAFRKVLESQRKFRETYREWRRLAYLPKDF